MVKYCPRCGAPNDDDANFCVKCGYRFPVQQTSQAPPPSGQPQQPHPSKQRSKQNNEAAGVVLAVALLVLLVLLVAPLVYNSMFNSVTIANETLSVRPGGYVYYTVEVPSYAINPAFSISFTASGGTSNDICVFVIQGTAEFVEWQHGFSVPVIYNSGQVTAASTTVYLPGPGTYYIVFDNTFSWTSTKTVSVNIVLQY